MSLSKIIQWISVVWILITVGAVIASAPLAFRVVFGAEAAEPKVLAWVTIMGILCLPAGLALAYLRSLARREDISKWVPEEYRHKS